MRFRPFLFPSDFVVWFRIGNGKKLHGIFGGGSLCKRGKEKTPSVS